MVDFLIARRIPLFLKRFTLSLVRPMVYCLLLSLGLLGGVAPLYAEPATNTEPASATDNKSNEVVALKQKYTRKGADTCLKCHDEDYAYPVMDIFYSKHGNRNDPRSPMAQLQCETCHGPGRAHAAEPRVGQKRAAIVSFSEHAPFSVAQQNAPCLQCHKDAIPQWPSSRHQRQSVRCASCHQIHAKKDPVLRAQSQAQRCYACHAQQQAEMHRLSAHPVGRGNLRCGSCHDPHGSMNASLLRESSVNTLCYTCHAEKRGPFLWLHAPVQENCLICHEQHGASQANLLKQRAPFLCQSCHSTSPHPSFRYSGNDVTAGFRSNFVMGKACLNCHSQIHGSNHPSGVRFMR